MSLVSPALAGRFFTTSAPWEDLGNRITIIQNFHYSTLHTPVLQAHPHLPNASIFKLFPSLFDLSTKEQVDLFDPVFVIRLVYLGISSVNKAAEVCQVINKIKQLTDFICDRGAVGIHSLQMFFIHFTNTFHTLIHRFIVSVSSAFWPLGRLYQQDGVRHRAKVSRCSRCRLRGHTPILYFFNSPFPQLRFGHNFQVISICMSCSFSSEHSKNISPDRIFGLSLYSLKFRVDIRFTGIRFNPDKAEEI